MPSLGRYLDAELVERLDRLRPEARRNVDGVAPGAHRSLIKGASVSFRQHRPYVRGDNPRRLDWRVLARTDRLFIKEFDHDTNLHCVIAVDTSGSMAYGSATTSKFNYAATLCTALSYLLLRGGESVGLAVMSDGPGAWLPPALGATQLSQVVDRLEHATAAGRVDPAGSLQRLANRLKRRCLLVVISDFFAPPGPLGRTLARLVHGGHETLCLQVLHPDEITFPFRTFARLHNLEGHDARVTEPAVSRAEYQRNFHRHALSLRRACDAARSTLVTARTDLPVVAVVEQLFRQRSIHQP